MGYKKYFKLFMAMMSILLLIFILFMVFSTGFAIKRIVDDGGIYSFNSGDLVGHLLILFLLSGCLYFFIKASLLVK
jgi:hypothetical protein